MKTIYQQYIQQFTNYYSQDESAAIAKLVFDKIAKAEKLSFKSLLQIENKNFSKKYFAYLQNTLFRLAANEPVQHILGEVEFLHCKIKVNKNVLIPRPETEELVFNAIKQIELLPQAQINIIDLCTGSGCIAVALAKKFPNANIFALEKSEQAIQIAQQNAALNNVQIDFIQADIFEATFHQQFDFIISNPPYVRENEKTQIEKHVLAYEPHQALFVADNSALIFYERIEKIAVQYLKPNGIIFLEINQSLAQETAKIFQRNFKTEIQNDLFGNNRFVIAEKME